MSIRDQAGEFGLRILDCVPKTHFWEAKSGRRTRKKRRNTEIAARIGFKTVQNFFHRNHSNYYAYF